MDASKKKVVPIVLASVAFLVSFSQMPGATSQQQNKCPVDDANRTKSTYRVGRATHADKTGGDLYLYISVEPQAFNRDDMILLAKRLKEDFCYESKIVAILLDDYNAARRPLRNTKAYWDAERGIYQLNRKTAREIIKFASSRGRPQDEIVINLSSTSNR